MSHLVDDDATARSVVRDGISVLDAFVQKTDEASQFGKYVAYSEDERIELEGVRALIEDYLNWLRHRDGDAGDDEGERPLCIGVFGPPGSGKSFAVKQILKQVAPAHTQAKLNLSQIPTVQGLLDALVAVRCSKTGIPVVFFDEFDSALGGAPLGWLQSLLAPMEDGLVFHKGQQVKLKRAIFVFAGGTADSFEEFSNSSGESFRRAKGPDFVSRLRGHLDVRGPNAWPHRSIRRAVLLRLSLEKFAPKLLVGEKLPSTALDDDFLNRLLAVGRYRHGSRSVEALVQMSVRPTAGTFGQDDLPSPAVWGSHVDSGPLSGVVIALSAAPVPEPAPEFAGDEMPPLNGDRAKVESAYGALATQILLQGGAISYGGFPGVTQALLTAQSALPQRLVPYGNGGAALRFAPPRPGEITCHTVSFYYEEASQDELAVSESDLHGVITRKDLPGLSDGERQYLETEISRQELRYDLRRALELFRGRSAITGVADATVAIGGRLSGSAGRFPGIAEEIMLSLARSLPVYVCGAYGGGAAVVGSLLNLANAWATTPESLRLENMGSEAKELEARVRAWPEKFQLAHRQGLPTSYDELVEFLRSHAMGSEAWPDNGLTPTENRELFACDDPTRIGAFVEKGLRTLGRLS